MSRRARPAACRGSTRVALAASWRASVLAQGLGQYVHPVLRAGEAPSVTGRARQLTSSPIQGLPVAWLGMLRKGDWRRLKRTMSCSSCALLTTLLLLDVPVDLSSHHGCMDGAEKAHQELQFVWSRPQTAEIRCSRDALCRTGRQPAAVHF